MPGLGGPTAAPACDMLLILNSPGDTGGTDDGAMGVTDGNDGGAPGGTEDGA